MNVTIIGCGYVGSAVARCWRQQGLTVTATTTTPERIPELAQLADRAIVVQGTDASGLQALLHHQQVVLLSVGAPNRSLYQDTYLATAKTLVQLLSQNSSVEQVIYTGSYAVYGDHQGAWVTEESSIAPANENGEILAETERVLLSASSDRLRVCVLRLGGIYGPGRELVKIFGRIAGTTRAGDGTDASNWVHLDDIVGAIEFARVQQLQGIYNLVQDQPITTGELFDAIFSKHNLPPIRWDPAQPSTRPYNARVSNQKLRAAGYQVQYPVIEP
ncbi:MAG: SDR family oxidoreductase [Elainella sp. C42_A2020_010]|nr:SDR family oxidoreductase [Elainella sp. C42_A2020_010]